jgi:hypothetical protein
VLGDVCMAAVFSRMSSNLVFNSIKIRPTSSVVAKRVGWLLKACTECCAGPIKCRQGKHVLDPLRQVVQVYSCKLCRVAAWGAWTCYMRKI